MRIGKASRGSVNEKLVSIRHGHGSRRSCNAQEKAVETRVRQAAKREIRRAQED